MKTLLLMRHAKSDWSADYGRDHERPLNERGVRSARLMGRLLAAEGHAPQLIVTSTAVRARSTASLANEAGEWGAEIVLDPGLYGSGPDAAIQVAAAAPDVARLMLVGHQPTWSILFSVLTGSSVDMRTATAAVVGFDIPEWKQVGGSRGEVVAVYQPRDYEGTELDIG
ncbi:MAG TPA: histidine phosphatase family protein [Acidimicrobiia bacterium]|nr:histidine phosphatase family protein [Acidimicrobiia bacterium]